MRLTFRKITALLMSLLLILSILSCMTISAGAVTQTVSYIDADGNEKQVEAAVLGEDHPGQIGASGETAWYIIQGTYTTSCFTFFDSVVNLILADDADVYVSDSGISLIAVNGTVNFYGQTAGTGTLRANATILAVGEMHIYSGKLQAAEIRATKNSLLADMTISGGTVNANNIYAMNLTVTGGAIDSGRIQANGRFSMEDGSVSITGDSIAVMGNTGVAISGGTLDINNKNYCLFSDDGEISITGGNITLVTTQSMALNTRNHAVILSGGQIAIQSAEIPFSINATSVQLGCQTADSSLCISSFKYYDNSVTVIGGQSLTDGENVYSGTLTHDQLQAIAGKTLTCVHSWEWTVDEEPTCGDAGTKHEKCAICSSVRNEGTEISATGDHQTELVNVVEATADHDGYTGDKVCRICGQTISRGEVTHYDAAEEPAGETDAELPVDSLSDIFSVILSLFSALFMLIFFIRLIT